jgi:hypothetical protein
MNIDRLKAAENEFLIRYPQGFSSPEMEQIAKKHKMDKMVADAQAMFAEEAFTRPQQIAEDMVRSVSRSSMVSLFEKPKFRDYVKAMTHDEREALAFSLKDFLYGDQEYGFHTMRDLLLPVKLAKWSLMTIIPNYVKPDDEVFVKPTTAKGVIRLFELENLSYKPTPSYEFYQEYRWQIQQMKTLVDPILTPSNAAFSGFLMMSLTEN